MLVLAATNVVGWSVGLAGAIAALAGAGAIYLSVRRMRTVPAASGISPQQALALGIPLPGERSSQCGELPDLGLVAGGNPVPSRRLPTPASAEHTPPLSQAA